MNPTLPTTGPETFLEILEDFLSRQIDWNTLCGMEKKRNHEDLLTTTLYIISPFFLFHIVLRLFFLYYSLNFFYNLLFPFLKHLSLNKFILSYLPLI